jgi:futalosine hydrolase
LIIQCGCAGAFRKSGLTIGDIAVASRVIDAQLGIEAPENDPRLIHPLPFPVLINNANEIRHEYPVTGTLAQSALSILKCCYADSAVQVQSGPIISVSTVTAGEKRANRLYTQFRPCMEAMEGAASAHVALHYRIPFMEIRSASNLVGPRDRHSWNLKLAFERCSEAVAVFIQHLDSMIL